MEGVALRWRAATVVLQGLLAMFFLISGVSALKCHQYNEISPFPFWVGTPVSDVPGIINCSSAENVCTAAQLTLTIDKAVYTARHKGCARKDPMNGAESNSFTSVDRHFDIQFNQSYCFGDLCNAKTKTWNDPKTPLEDTAAEANSSNQCYAGFDDTSKRTMTCSKGYDRCYNGTNAIAVGGFTVTMTFWTCQRPACDGVKSHFFGPINITSEPGSCCSGSNCNGKIIRNNANPILSYDHYGSGFQGLSLQLCPFLAVLGTTTFRIWG